MLTPAMLTPVMLTPVMLTPVMLTPSVAGRRGVSARKRLTHWDAPRLLI